MQIEISVHQNQSLEKVFPKVMLPFVGIIVILSPIVVAVMILAGWIPPDYTVLQSLSAYSVSMVHGLPFGNISLQNKRDALQGTSDVDE